MLEYLDEVVQTTAAVHDQVEGEARFGRAYYHFMLLTQYCLWDEDKPGIGYRDNAKAERFRDGDCWLHVGAYL